MNPGTDTLGTRTIRKVTRRLLPFIFILYVIAFLDRVNFGYAALDMNPALGISAEVFGFLSGIFFIGYLIFEIPSNVIMNRIGARVWITRIMISWGIVVIATAAATSAFHLAIFRFILGIAEAGFFPGMILYITFWFREKELARAVALFMAALAVSNIIGAPVSTWILDNVSWFGIAGWRWLFILEGIPAVLFGIVTWFYLTDRPADAKWLEPEERTWLAGELERERSQRVCCDDTTGFKKLIRDARIWHLAAIYCAITIGLYGLGFWMPQIVRSLNPAFTNFEIGMILIIPFTIAAVAMILWGRHSDRTGERKWHAAIPPIVGGIGLAAAGIASSPLLAFCLLIVATVGIYCFFGPFWTLPPVFLTGAAAAIGIAIINSIGNTGGFIGPSLVGVLTQSTGSMQAGLIGMGCILVLCGILVLRVKPAEHR